MKNKILLIIILTIGLESYSQQIVLDPTVVSTLWANHSVQNSNLSSINKEQKNIKGIQSAIALKLVQIKALEDRVMRSLSQVQSVVRDGKNVIYASTIASDIGKYQAELLRVAGSDPALYVIAYKMELELINRTFDMYTYIQTALKGGEGNLMSNIDRMSIIQKVIDDLKIMRGVSFGVLIKVRNAKWSGSFDSLLAEFGLKAPAIFNINKNSIKDKVLGTY